MEIKLFSLIKNVLVLQRIDEENQVPKVLELVLDGSSCQQKPISAVERQESFPTEGIRILDCLGFVQNHVLPLDTFQLHLILQNNIIRSHNYIVCAVFKQLLWVNARPDILSLDFVTPVGKDPKLWVESLDFSVPVVEC